MGRFIVAVLVYNRYGVLNRVTSMFRRRQFNISTLTVSETESHEYSRITVTFEGSENAEQQLVNQLYKLPDVVSIKELDTENSVNRELLLIKVANTPETRVDVMAAAEAFRAQPVDYSKDAIVLQLTDTSRRIDDFINVMRDNEILEICRTGVVSLEKGATTIRKITNL